MKETLSHERDHYWHEVGILQKTEGFPLLTEDQQKMIVLSLYVQDRSERYSHSIWEITKSQSDQPTEPYQISKDHIRRWFCHAAVQTLESGIPMNEDPMENYPLEFFDGKYVPIENKNQAKKLIESFGFPAVVNINVFDHNEGRRPALHTFLALGHSKHGEIVVWEKEGYGLPYRITNLDEQLGYYGTKRFWGIRHLVTDKRNSSMYKKIFGSLANV